MKARETQIPVLRPQPTLLEVVKMEQGKLAKETFGKPTDPVFDVITVPNDPEPTPRSLGREG